MDLPPNLQSIFQSWSRVRARLRHEAGNCWEEELAELFSIRNRPLECIQDKYVQKV